MIKEISVRGLDIDDFIDEKVKEIKDVVGTERLLTPFREELVRYGDDTGLRDGERDFDQQVKVRCWNSVDAHAATPT